MPALRSSTFASPRLLAGCFGLMAAFAFIGCGGKDSNNDAVSGKVTVGGSAVSGEIAFVGADKKEYKSPINASTGQYQIIGAPKGDYQVIVKGMGGGLGPAPKTEGYKGSDLASAGGGSAPPAKYAQPNNGLTFTVTGGKQDKNFELSP